MDICKIFMLSTGESVLGKIVTTDEHLMIVNRPILLKNVMTEQGMQFLPCELLPSLDANIKFNIQHIITMPSDPVQALSDLYLKITSSIIAPKKSDLKLV